ncbi:phosphatase [Planctomycetales bacterium]|nr:phosphatase [Planctomycetales bacterium]GHS99590.1 phosphatase [Planctomycetales bacterium]
MRNTVIFDMDGVLVNSQPLHFEVDLATLRTAGVAATLADVEHCVGLSTPDSWAHYRRKFNLRQSVDELRAAHDARLLPMFRAAELQPVAGIPALLALLKDRGVKTAVASSSSWDLIHLILGKLQIAEFFDALVSGEDLPHSKPAPDIFLRAAAAVQSEPAACAVIEDAATGVLAAKRAAMFCVAYRNPTSGKQDLSLADWRIDTFDAINQNLDWLQRESLELKVES